MIRKFQQEDINDIMKIWLDSNVTVHNFIPKSYWEKNYDLVKEMIPKSTLYVYEDQKEIRGFIGKFGQEIAGIFVCSCMRSKGIGKQLLDYVKQKEEKLILQVYEKNERAIEFYLRQGFSIQEKQIDENTGEVELVMIWEYLG